ncbi:DMT family transporter [Cellvibrio sp.]|uniref:DMT family transporter n=1 Tax=Cellvibrio sp. TaxID=1965322 RepID=UPI00396486A1
MSSTKSALITLHVGAFLMAATGLFSQIINLPAWDITGYRTWIAAGVLFAWVWWREGRVALDSARDYRRMLLLGVLLCVHWITFFHSMQVSNIAIGMLSLYAYPVMTVFMEPLLKGTKIDWGDVASGMFVLVGIYFLVPEFDFSNSMTQGVLWGILSAFTFALRNLLLGYWFSGQSSARSMSYQVLVVALLMTPVILTSKNIPNEHDWILIVILGLFFTAFSHTLFGYALRYLKAKTVGLVACMQPVYGVVYGMIILKSIPDKSTLVGGAIIVTAAIYESLREHNKSAMPLTD